MNSKNSTQSPQPVITVYYDVSSLNPKKITGVGVYILELLRNLKNDPSVRVIPVLKPSRLKNKSRLENLIGGKVQPLWPWTGLFTKNALYHGPDFKVQMGNHLPRMVTVHDMVVFEGKYNTPEFYKKGIEDLSKVLKSSLASVIVNSEFTKSEVLKHFPELENKVDVTLLGCDRDYPIGSNETNLPKKYILFLGTLEKRKNATGAIAAFEELCKMDSEIHLVMAGAWGFGAEDIQKALKSSAVKNRISHLNYVSNELIPTLFKNAQAFLYPSWYEGFGIPVLESMTLGCPVVTSSGGALEEVTGDAALHADPTNAKDMALKVNAILSNPSLRDELIKKGRLRAASFTWKSCAEKTVLVYQKVLKNR